MPNKPVIAIDFDGTLVHNKYPNLENPNIRLIYWIKDHRQDFIFILWTCRQGDRLQEAIQYLYENFGLEFDYVNENALHITMKYGDSRKINADYYIDDRNLFNYELLK